MAWRQWLENGSVQRFADRDQTDLCSASPKTGTMLLAVFPTVLHDRKACKKGNTTGNSSIWWLLKFLHKSLCFVSKWTTLGLTPWENSCGHKDQAVQVRLEGFGTAGDRGDILGRSESAECFRMNYLPNASIFFFYSWVAWRGKYENWIHQGSDQWANTEMWGIFAATLSWSCISEQFS